jgi:hypothetical protein
MNSKVNISQTKACIENKRGIELGSISICPWPASPGPYIYVATSQETGRVQYKLQHPYMIQTRILTMTMPGPGLMGLRGTQIMGSISYTLVSSPRDSTRIIDSG